MPIFKWKKTRRYEVSSRNSYVVCVHLLDTSLIECTLTADSVGEECLENIAQRIELSQCEYFGLRYVNKKLQFRWVELDKPLKKQLDRYAHSPLLYFGVMYYVPDAQRIEDDMTRYQYYLQLKSDIIEGKLPCSTEKAVLLAAYSLQAELGDFDYERHTVENLKDAVLLPRNMAVDDRSLLELTQDIINNHQTLVRWSAATAEVEYILEAQQLEGYGVDYYSAKDHSGQEVLLGAYYLGIFVKILDCQQPVQHYKWAEITHLSCNKKHFTITTRHKEKPVQFTMDDPDTAKYIQRLFTLQMCFFTGRTAITTDPGHSVGSRTPDVPNSHVEVNTSQTSVPVDIGNASPASLGSTTIPASQFETTNHIAEPQFEPANPVTDTVDPSVTILNTPSALSTSSPDGRMYYSNGNIYSVNGSQGDNANSTTSPQSIRQSPHLPQQSQFVPQQSSSVPYHTSNSYLNSTPAPPSYRHTPDYETVMRQRVAQQQQIQQQQQQQQLAYLSNIINSQAYNAQHPETLAYSQPDIHHLQQTSFQPQALQQQTGDVLPNGSAIHYVESSPSHHQHYPLRPVDRTSSLIIYPTYTTSPQEQQNTGNAVFNNQTDPSVTVSQYTNNYRAPPPYPRGASTSTPDLASQTMRSNMSSSPDLISRRNLIQNQGLMVQSFLDQSVENLALDTQKLLISQSTATRSKQILDDSSSLQSDAVSRDQYLSSSVNQAGSIPDVAHSAMMAASGSSSGLLPMQDYYTNTPQPQVIRSSGAVQRASSMHRSGGRSSSRSLPQYSHSNAQQQQLQAQQLAQQQQQAQQLAQQQAQQQQQLQQHQQQQQLPPADFSFSNPNSFDNPAFRDNLPLYLREMATESNPKPANPTATQFQAASNQNEALQTSAVQNVVPQQPSTNQQKPTVTVPPGDSPQQTSAGPVVLRKKKSSKSGGDGTKEGDPDRDSKRLSMGALRMAALNGLTLSSGSVLDDAMGDEVDGITKETTPPEEVTRVPKDERRRQLEAKLVADQVFIEFETVPKKRMKCECNAAGQPANKERNRFKDVLPYDDNRVQLTPVKDNPMGYINASHVKLRIGDEELWYMATQGPLPNTVTDFWQVIWEQDVEVIAMLTKVQEHGKPKCHQYWPERLGPKNKVTHNQYQIVMKFSNNAGPYTTSGLLIKHLPSNRERLVWHLQYTDWPDHGCPEDVHGFLAFLDEVDAIKRQTQMQKSESRRVPILVHCSAGVGRTGVVILTEAIKACLEHNENVDVPGMLSRLRDQRMHSVQTVSQYSFVYKTLVEYLKGSRLI